MLDVSSSSETNENAVAIYERLPLLWAKTGLLVTANGHTII